MAFPSHAHHVGATKYGVLRVLHAAGARTGTGRSLTKAAIAKRLSLNGRVSAAQANTAALAAVSDGNAEVVSTGVYRLTRAGNRLARHQRPLPTAA